MRELSDCRVLLVDDAKANLDILVEGLKSDHKLSLPLNGEMALQVASRTPPDLVLLDIVMPGLDARKDSDRPARGWPPNPDRTMNKRNHSLVRRAIIVLAGISLGVVPLATAPAELPPLTTVPTRPMPSIPYQGLNEPGRTFTE